MRGCLFFVLLAVVVPAGAQQRDTTPFNCERIKGNALNAWHVEPMRQMCRDLEANQLRSTAKMKGAPRPSASVVKMPGYGTEAGKAIGLVCMGGQAMRRLPNGWEQLRDATGNWQRCEPI